MKVDFMRKFLLVVLKFVDCWAHFWVCETVSF